MLPYTITYGCDPYIRGTSDRVHQNIYSALIYAIRYCNQYGGYTEIRDRQGILCWVVWQNEGKTVINGINEEIPEQYAHLQEDEHANHRNTLHTPAA
jgi:hypothetical protein